MKDIIAVVFLVVAFITPFLGPVIRLEMAALAVSARAKGGFSATARLAGKNTAKDATVGPPHEAAPILIAYAPRFTTSSFRQAELVVQASALENATGPPVEHEAQISLAITRPCVLKATALNCSFVFLGTGEEGALMRLPTPIVKTVLDGTQAGR